MSIAPNGNAPTLAIVRTPQGIKIASSLTDVRLQLILMTEAMNAILVKLVELHPPEQPRIVVPTNGGLQCP